MLPTRFYQFLIRLMVKSKVGFAKGFTLRVTVQSPFLFVGVKKMKSDENPNNCIAWTINNELSCKEHDNQSRFLAVIIR